MHQGIYMDAHYDPSFSWMSWMFINAQDNPKCSWMSIDAQDDPQCSWMSIDTTHDPQYSWTGCLLMHLDVLALT